MSQKRILFADNDLDFLAARTEFLELAGYEVLAVNSVEQAEQSLSDLWFHLAILDVRLIDDEDERDLSGLTLAKKSAHNHIPKIVLTQFPEYVQAALEGLSPMVGFLAKREGPEALVRAVERAFADRMQIDWSMAIDWKGCDPYSLVNYIEPGIEGQRLFRDSEELGDLFRRLFHQKQSIRVERLIWHRDGRVATIVFAFKEGEKPEYFTVICGQKTIANQESRRFSESAPKAPGDMGTILSFRSETTHFAANAYAGAGNNLEKAETLHDLFRFSSERMLNDALSTLLRRTLEEWHQNGVIQLNNTSVAALYRQRLGLSKQQFSQSHFAERIGFIENQIAGIGLGIDFRDDYMTFRLGSRSLSFPNPSSLLFLSPEMTGTALTNNVPGTLTGENILADASGRVWLTDFADAGMAPLFWNQVALESVIRFDWVETTDPMRSYEMENCLLNTDFAKPDTRGLEPGIGKPARAVATIRRLSAQVVGEDTHNYNLGVFFQAVRRLADTKPDGHLTSGELSRLGHILLAMAMIAGRLEQDLHDRPPATPTLEDEISIADEKARIIQVGLRQVQLPPQPFEVFRYLYHNMGQVSTKEDLLNTALKGAYSEDYLHTLVGRIRKLIEDDPEEPRYLVTVPSAGYRLNASPKP